MVVIIGVITFFFLFLIFIYNRLIGKKNDVENSWAGIEVQLVKRYDLIPNLIETVKNYMKYEKETLANLTEMRTRALNSTSVEDKVDLDNKISKSLGQIMVSVENYPDLKASENMQILQRSLNEIEEQLAASRRGFNAAVTSYNNGVQMFPSSIVAGILNYERKELFIAEDHKRENIEIKNLF